MQASVPVPESVCLFTENSSYNTHARALSYSTATMSSRQVHSTYTKRSDVTNTVVGPLSQVAARI
ncbi:MAG: hypothetical protein ACPIOQ_48725, partial [Promethearchaeia archaeon]